MTTEPGPTPAKALQHAQGVVGDAARGKIRADLADAPPPKPAQLTRAFSYLLDDLVQVPGTKVRVGLDPVLSLIPWAGTAVGAVFGGVVLVDAIRLRAPLPVLTRMVGNSVLDWLVGMVPFIGAFFDVAFRSNKKNLRLLNRTIENRELVRQASVKYWMGVGGLALVLLAVIVAIPVVVILGVNQLIATAG
ncbi:DUF4112 domain-containing protein [Tessaracoccus sp. Z1128]